MRIALACLDRGVPLGGPKGCSVHLRAVAGALRRGGHEVTVMVAAVGPREDFEHLLEDGVGVEPLDSIEVDPIAGRLAAFDPELVIERLALLAPQGALAAAARDIPHVYEVNAPLDLEAAEHRGCQDTAAAREAFRQGFRRSRAAIAVSDEVAGWIRGLAPAELPILVVPNGAEPMFFEAPNEEALASARRRLGFPSPYFHIGFAGSFKAWHDLDTLVCATAMLDRRLGARLLLIGAGPEHRRVIAMAEALDVPVDSVGRVAHRDMPAYLALCEVVAVPYARLDAYFSPIKLVEAMAAGRAVVASATGPCARILRDGENGLLVPPGDAEALALALGRLGASPALRRQLGAQARETAQNRHTWDGVATRVLDFARPLLSGTGSRS